MVVMTSNEMVVVARDVLGLPQDKATDVKAENGRFRSFFGASIDVVVNVWNRLESTIDSAAKPKHLLWSLVFLKIYGTEDVHCRITGWPDPKTFRKWTWYFLEQISALKDNVINLDNRFDGFDGSTNCLISVDGTHCPVMEPWPFDRKWYSQKFNGPGVKYEVGVCIKTGFIVWVNGPFVASTNDATIFTNGLVHLLTEDEGVEVDAGYKGHPKFKSPSVNISRNQRQQKANVRSRHETINGRLKIYNVLNIAFRHMKPREEMMEKHKKCFYSVAVITQTKFELGETSFDVDYDTAYY
jgi:DDE superfamily endonuclease